MQEEQRVGVVATLWCCRASIVMFVSAVVEIFFVLCGGLGGRKPFCFKQLSFSQKWEGATWLRSRNFGTINFHFLLEQLFCTMHDARPTMTKGIA